MTEALDPNDRSPRRLSPWMVLAALYLLVLGASHVARRLDPWEPLPAPDERSISLRTVSGDRERTGSTIRFVWRESGNPEGPVVILLHGSPGSNNEVKDLGAYLEPRYRVISPDLPGFGASSHRIPDYSFRAHARYLLQLLDSLRIPDAHWVGFSMGGGVILSAADLAPDRIRSLVLLSALGTQEFELLGDYWLNHAIHGLQLAGLWLLREAVPHFGAWDPSFLGVAYARNFYDSDQRPLRRILQEYQGPAFIIQGKRDDLVPKEAALESHRLLPQSELLMLEGNHFMTFQRPGDLAPPLLSFLARVDGGVAPTRASAPAERVAAANAPFTRAMIPRATGLALSVLLLLLAAATLVSEDLTCIGAGLLVARGTVAFLPATIACIIGIVVGDLLLFAAGRFLGRPALPHPPLSWIVKPADVRRASEWFARRGPWLVLATRFLPGTRLPTYVAAGILRTRALTFAGVFLLAAVLWTPALVGLAAVFGNQVGHLLQTYRTFAGEALLILGVVLFALLRIGIPLCSFRGRRLLLSRWYRITRWEFWPRTVLYAPIAFYILWLALRHRGLLLLTAVNPGMPGGGFVGERKHEILQRLAGAGDAVPPWCLLPRDPAAALDAIRAFQAEHQLAFPLVLKPNIGERGAGVQIIHSPAEAEEYLKEANGEVLAQAFVEGIEFGVFWYRYPHEAEGRIFSITEKHFPAVTGDGTRTLEALILNDPRAVMMAPTYLARHAAQLDTIPAAGAVVPLVEIGTHSRGAVFRDGTALRTRELEAEINRLSRTFDGFYFGRFDLRVPSVEDFQAGRNLRIIELNGATAEATSIYDPAHRVWTAWRTLATQWRILFEIAAANRAAGTAPATAREMRELFRAHREAQRGHVT